MLRSKLAISGAVMALGAGGVLATPGLHAAAAPAGVMSVTITPESSPLLLGAKAAVTASVADGAVARKGEVLKFAITSSPIHARVDTNTVKLPTPLGGLLAGALTLTFLTPPSGFWVGETVNIVDPTTHQNEKVTIAGALTSPPTPAGLLWTLTAPTQFTHSSGTVTGSWAHRARSLLPAASKLQATSVPGPGCKSEGTTPETLKLPSGATCMPEATGWTAPA